MASVVGYVERFGMAYFRSFKLVWCLGSQRRIDRVFVEVDFEGYQGGMNRQE